jgi:MFS family permease
MSMRPASSPLLLFGTLFTAAGYGATFLISAWFRSRGGTDMDTGATLGAALVGTLIGVPMVGWFAGRVDASRLSAVAALTMSCGYLLLGSAGASRTLPPVAAALIGLGWGMFYIAGPMALSERITDAERGQWFTRFSAFQMAGICGSPILLAALVAGTGASIQHMFSVVGGMGLLAASLLGGFASREPRAQRETSLRPWVGHLSLIARTPAIRPVIMVGLGGCVFSGMMSFQGSLAAGTGASPSSFFAVHAVTVVISRLLLARRLALLPRLPLVSGLLGCLVAGLVCLWGMPLHPVFQIAAAVLTGLGYGLVYPVIQTWAINDSAQAHRHAVLTWFVVAYFVGIFGYPVIGGWILVNAGKAWLVASLIVLACLEWGAARWRPHGARPPPA